MAQQSLYRRYRPRRFGELRGQDHVVRALRNAVATGTEGHAYLFSGPRGTGKTSTARILAKALNCDNLTDGEPCCECEPCVAMEAGRSFDLFELDAASNNGVDAVRDLIERSAVGSPGRTKVYILDEVHMLTAAASNALLKTLEEPPGHVRFVLATTDPQKVLPTIKSRTQHFEFQLLSADELEDYVRWIVADAGLDVDDEAVAHVVRQGRGSARDTLSALDQVVAAGGVMTRSEPVDLLFSALADRSSGGAVLAVADALAQGHDPRVLGEAFLAAVRDAFLLSLGVDVPHLVDADREGLGQWAATLGTPRLTRAMERVGTALVDMRQAADPRVPLEVALVQLTVEDAVTGAGATGDGGTASVDAGVLADLVARVERLEAGSAPATKAPATAAPAPAAPAPAAQAVAAPTPAPVEETADEDASADRAPAAVDRPPTADPRGAALQAKAALGAVSAKRAVEAPHEAPKPAAGARATAPQPPPRRVRAGAPPPSQDRRPAPPGPADSPPGPTAAPPAAPPGPAAAGTGGLPDRDALVMAFGDVVVAKLRGMAKALFTGGRFVAVTDSAAVFAFDNAPTRDRAEKYRGEVEAMLSAHFATPVPLQLIVEADAARHADTARHAGARRGSGGAPAAPAPRVDPAVPSAAPTAGTPAPATRVGNAPRDAPSAAPVSDVDDDDEEGDLMIDLNELEDADDVAVSGLDRLTAAFPGAELIQTDEGAQP